MKKTVILLVLTVAVGTGLIDFLISYYLISYPISESLIGGIYISSGIILLYLLFLLITKLTTRKNKVNDNEFVDYEIISNDGKSIEIPADGKRWNFKKPIVWVPLLIIGLVLFVAGMFFLSNDSADSKTISSVGVQSHNNKNTASTKQQKSVVSGNQKNMTVNGSSQSSASANGQTSSSPMTANNFTQGKMTAVVNRPGAKTANKSTPGIKEDTDPAVVPVKIEDESNNTTGGIKGTQKIIEKPVAQGYTDPNGKVWMHMKVYDVPVERPTEYIYFGTGIIFSIWPSDTIACQRVDGLGFVFYPGKKVDTGYNSANVAKRYQSLTGKMEHVTVYSSDI